jgi:hypothetical protein
MSDFKTGDLVEYNNPDSWHFVGTYQGANSIRITKIYRKGEFNHFKAGDLFHFTMENFVKKVREPGLPKLGSTVRVVEVFTGKVNYVDPYFNGFTVKDGANLHSYFVKGNFGTKVTYAVIAEPVELKVGDIVDLKDDQVLDAIKALPVGSVLGAKGAALSHVTFFHSTSWEDKIDHYLGSENHNPKVLVKILQIGPIEW